MLTVMDPCKFCSDLEPQELEKRFLKLLESLEEEKRTYALKPISPGLYRIESSTTTGNHQKALEVARFISEVIKPGKRTLLVLRTLTGEARGFLIERKRVRRVRWVPVVENEDGSFELLDKEKQL